MQAPTEFTQVYCMECETEAYAVGFDHDAEGNLWLLCFCGNDECDNSTQANWMVRPIRDILHRISDQSPRPKGMDNGYL